MNVWLPVSLFIASWLWLAVISRLRIRDLERDIDVLRRQNKALADVAESYAAERHSMIAEQMARIAADRQRRSAAASRGHENRRRKAVKISEWEGQA